MNPLRQRTGRRAARANGHAAPAPLAPPPAPPLPADYAQLLQALLPPQRPGVSSHRFGGERVWLKKAGPRHGRLRYRLLAAISAVLRLDVLTPVPNPGGPEAIAIEARRLRTLAEAGLRVPRVLAQQDEGLLMSDLGESGRGAMTLEERLQHAAAEGPAALLAAWREGLEAIARVHARGQYLSQAFARNLVCCPDGEIGFIDFEDDPGAVLSLVECQTRDWLSYLHATAMPLHAAAARGSGAEWHDALAGIDPEVRTRLAHAAHRMRWLTHLPASRRWGRDTQRVRAAARLLREWYGPPPRPRPRAR